MLPIERPGKIICVGLNYRDHAEEQGVSTFPRRDHQPRVEDDDPGAWGSDPDGTPAGVGVFRNPQRLLRPGEVTVEIEGAGLLTNPVVVDARRSSIDDRRGSMSIARTVLREQVKDVLLERILRGELEPGERLVETRLARELGTSQAPVREALRDLELLRLVESEPFRGARVRAVDDSQLLPVFPVRAVLEELAASEAARNPERDPGALERELEAMREAAAGADWRTQVAHDLAFHRTMVQMAGNEPLLQSWLVLGVEVSTAFATYHTLWDQAELAEFHVPIVEAVRAGDSRRAGAEARKHVRRTERVVRRRVRDARRVPAT